MLMQSFSKGRWARYWTVKRAENGFGLANEGDDDDDGDSSDSAVDSGYEFSFDSRLTRYGKRLASEEEEAAKKRRGPGGVDVDCPWVAWTRWAEHFQEKDLAQISRMSKRSMADAKLKRVWLTDEKHRQLKLRLIMDSSERVMARCQGSAALTRQHRTASRCSLTVTKAP